MGHTCRKPHKFRLENLKAAFKASTRGSKIAGVEEGRQGPQAEPGERETDLPNEASPADDELGA